ncbi:MAG: hypothetical protein AB1744_13830, partial [Candidatus Zixiibacteriota bacterium]
VVFAQDEPPQDPDSPPTPPDDTPSQPDTTTPTTDAPGVGQGEAGENTADNAVGESPSGLGELFVLVIEVVVIIVVIGAIVAILSKARKPKDYYALPQVPGTGPPTGGETPPAS